MDSRRNGPKRNSQTNLIYFPILEIQKSKAIISSIPHGPEWQPNYVIQIIMPRVGSPGSKGLFSKTFSSANAPFGAFRSSWEPEEYFWFAFTFKTMRFKAKILGDQTV